MKLYTVTFFENDGDGCVESTFYGIFETYELAYEALKNVIAHEGQDINKLYVCPPQYLHGSILRLSPRYGEYFINSVELNQVEFNGWPKEELKTEILNQPHNGENNE